MAYSLEFAQLLTKTLRRLVTFNRHQFAGQAANWDFWLAEVAHALKVIDEYNERFERMKSAQQTHVTVKSTIQFDPKNPHDYGEPVAPPRRVPDHERRETRRELCDAAYGFVVRCHNLGHVKESAAEAALRTLGISLDLRDFQRE